MEMQQGRSSVAAVEKGTWQRVVQCLLRTRRTEERLIRLYHQAKIFGGVYTGVGQEAIGAATALAAGPEALFAPCIRDMSVHIARGETLLNIFRQWLARGAGPTRGRDGNVHYGNLKNGVYAMISHLGAMLPVVVGGVMARRRLGHDTVGVAYCGEGATSTGDFHEAINFAAVNETPVLFVVENNQFAYSTPKRFQFKCESLVYRAPGYGIDGHLADGNDAVGLFQLASQLFSEMRSRPRAILLECDTLRMRGHGEHDDFAYVPAELLEKYRARDPLAVARRRLTRENIFSDAELDAMDRAVEAEVNEAYQTALAEPLPNPATLLKGIYADD